MLPRFLRFLFGAAAALAAAPPSGTLGSLSAFSLSDPTTVALTATVAGTSTTVPLRLQFWGPFTVRYWLALDGNFSDIGAAADVIVGAPDASVALAATDKGATVEVAQVPAGRVSVSLQKSPLLLSILVDGAVVVQEAAPLAWNDFSSWSTLARDAAALPAGLSKEWFFGGGMQNGRFSHRDQTIDIAVDYNWDEGGHPNSAPWYMSTAGYGVLRNTWAPGTYSFTSPVTTAHNESNRFDAFFMLAGPGPMSLKTLLGLYTALTGPPFLVPLYGLYLGDSDCYHNDRHGNNTQVAIAVAQLYVENDMPHGWMLPNDGYGCGYGISPPDGKFPSNLTDLTYVVSELHARGFYTGLWTSTGMPNIQKEVGIAGTRVCKTDVGWIGAGYKYAFDGVTLCAGGIEDFSTPPARRFVWTVEGWAATHRLAVMWTGDNSGSMDYVKWQLPTFVGTGFSAQAHVSGDIDGIFGGSPESYTRDLQFKALMTTFMVMSGWAANPDKQPWTWGEPYTTFNRAALKLKARLTPYMYSASREAHDTGVPPVRALLLEFPEDENLYAPTAEGGATHSFMSGGALLVAPVYTAGAVTRDGIYLPNGTFWLDYWNGTIYPGGATLDGYDAPLSKVPLFVRAGAIVPMWPANNHFDEAPADPLYLELWPAGSSAFSLYEDDGVTRAALPPTNAWTRTPISVTAPANYLVSGGGAANVTISVGPAGGAGFPGALASRGWRLNVRCRSAPLQVVLATPSGGAAALPQAQSEAQLEYEPQGWYHDDSLQPGVGGVLMVKLSDMGASEGFTVTLSNGPAWPKIGAEACDTPTHHQVENQKFAWNATLGKLVVVAAAPAGAPQCVTVGADRDPESHTPAVEVQPCAAAADGAQQLVQLAASGGGVQIALKADRGTCLDQDMADGRVIAYGCHDASSPGNQAWMVDASTQHIVSLANGLCMCVLGA